MEDPLFLVQDTQALLQLVPPLLDDIPVPEKRVRKTRKQEFIPFEMTWFLLERVLKHYYEFMSLYQQEGIDELTLDNGVVVNIYDILKGLDELPDQQRIAIELTCLQNMREVEAAKKMFPNSPWSSQVGTLKRQGLVILAERYWSNNGLV